MFAQSHRQCRGVRSRNVHWTLRPELCAKRVELAVPLWTLFIAVQLLDVFWSMFVLLGIEKVRIVPGFTKTNALDLYYMPYTHSLPGAVAGPSLQVSPI